MPSFTVRKTAEEAARLTSPAVMHEQWRVAVVKTQQWMLETLIEQHFMLTSPNNRYKPNKPTYEAWKKQHGGGIFQLVVSGRLKAAVINGKVQQDGTILFDLPEYGLYQIRAGRDFLSLDAAENKLMSERFTKEFFALRKKFVQG